MPPLLPRTGRAAILATASAAPAALLLSALSLHRSGWPAVVMAALTVLAILAVAVRAEHDRTLLALLVMMLASLAALIVVLIVLKGHCMERNVGVLHPSRTWFAGVGAAYVVTSTALLAARPGRYRTWPAALAVATAAAYVLYRLDDPCFPDE